jgi:maltokinase
MTLPYAEWLPRQRWYAGRGRDLAHVEPVAVTALRDDLDHVVLEAAYVDGGVELYQVFVGWDGGPPPEYARLATIGSDGARTGFDALYDDRAARYLLELINAGTTVNGLRFVPEPDVILPVDAPARVVDGEQSNTSVVFEGTAILKVFRRVLAGVNPDLELNRVLARAGCPNVAHLLGAVEGRADQLGAVESSDANGEPVSLAMVTAYAENSADGWSMAVTSARDLFAEPELPADEVGGDLAGESYRLGEAVAAVHRALAEELGSIPAPLPVDVMLERLDAAARAVPDLVGYVPAVQAAFRAAGDVPVPIQRIHGDLHLGQVLRTPKVWLLIDFEGEPGHPLAERRRPDSPLRDVAGMLRSFEYAAYQLVIEQREEARLGARAEEWVQRNQTAFCDGYAALAGFDPRDQRSVLTAYELDKAVYEVAYEARHRPNWLRIPLQSIERMLG